MCEQLTALYERHYGDVLRYALRRVDAELAREVAAETFTVAWRRLDRLPAEPLPWLYAVARRVLANELRARHRRERLTGRLAAAAAAAGGISTVQPDHADAVATTADVRAALARLAPRDQEILQLIAWEDLDVTAASRVVGCSTTAAKVRLHRARRRLTAALGHAAEPPPRPDPSASTQEVSS